MILRGMLVVEFGEGDTVAQRLGDRGSREKSELVLWKGKGESNCFFNQVRSISALIIYYRRFSCLIRLGEDQAEEDISLEELSSCSITLPSLSAFYWLSSRSSTLSRLIKDISSFRTSSGA